MKKAAARLVQLLDDPTINGAYYSDSKVTLLMDDSLKVRLMKAGSNHTNLLFMAVKGGVRVGFPPTPTSTGLTTSALLIPTRDILRLMQSIRMVVSHLLVTPEERPAMSTTVISPGFKGFRIEVHMYGEMVKIRRVWNRSLAKDFVEKIGEGARAGPSGHRWE